ncbi:hypothetical protein [uncultured Nisaea sp.]|uniref:hypothetical protein n=1 Tax=uncultured Nisaea sp. TaxID=538215 RepID=UPI0030EE6FE9|tara:strand:- start:4415 stop:5623 length:1209 start_codon:yes stop_codon:yes gene_type:complete
MRSLHISPGGEQTKNWLRRIPLGARSSNKDEKWLQELLFLNPDLIPVQEIVAGAGDFVPVCRELTIPKAGGSVYLDLFGVTPEGRLVLVECKLWRNPQARREVIAQILEYASLVKQWSYGDLSARVQSALKTLSENPIFEIVSQYHPDLDEARFVDRLTETLRRGDFILIIAGDGIRADVHAISDYLNQSSGLAARMALVEFQLWEGNAGLVVMPHIPLKTEMIEQRIVTSGDGTPLQMERPNITEEDAEDLIDQDRAASKLSERAFWQSFIDQVRFEHPDQPGPRHGGHAWVRIPMPEPIGWITAFRASRNRGGLFMRFKGDEGEAAVSEIEAARSALEDAIGVPMRIDVNKHDPYEATVSVDFDGSTTNDEAYLNWLLHTANAVVSVFRPFLHQIHIESA